MSEWENPAKFPPFWKPKKKGDKVEGIAEEIRTGKFGPILQLQTKEGRECVGGGTLLSRIIPSINPGDQVRITYLGKEKSKSSKYTYNSYEVLRKKVTKPE
jgi:hypothetical protein